MTVLLLPAPDNQPLNCSQSWNSLVMQPSFVLRLRYFAQLRNYSQELRYFEPLLNYLRGRHYFEPLLNYLRGRHYFARLLSCLPCHLPMVHIRK
jgi:hypothetical protein